MIEKPATSDTELIFLGTGTSSSVPSIVCLTAPPETEPCRACLATLKPEGKKNIRRNTSIAVRMPAKDGSARPVTIVVDVGKNFQAAALEWFPKYGLRRIDAVLISHAHSDAMNGLDDLRAWTLGEDRIQPYIDVYVSQETFVEIKRCFPYLDQVFQIEGTGINVTPFLVHHGRLFSNDSTTLPTAPLEQLKLDKTETKEEIVLPYLCFGFKFEQEIAYISDVSFIPESVWPILNSQPLLLCVLDCLHILSHPSHLGLKDSIATARRIGAARTYLTGFSHRVSHDEYVTITEAVSGKPAPEELTITEKKGLEMLGEGKVQWIRPGYDGLRVHLKDSEVWDDSYD
ncbi:beta-lactamase-like protein [Mycena floridula]|nr:beta-lactamase-like protein [Mycena floridula]